jgi:fimbrial chaperone protein
MLSFRSFLLGACIVLGSLFSFLPEARAASLGVEPLLLEISPNQSAAIRVRNGSDLDIPVEVFVFRRDVDEDGNQIRVPADDDFIIFPPQATIKADKRQVFRVRPVTVDPSKSTSYYISFSQVPESMESFEGGGAKLQVVFAFDAAVHVVPRKAEAKPVIRSAALDTMTITRETGELVAQEDGSQVPITQDVTVPAVTIDMENEGNKFLYLHQQAFTATLTGDDGTSQKVVWDTDEVIKAAKVTLLEPTERRQLKLPLPDGMMAATVDMKVAPRPGL